jgi:hypothetical protein
MATIFFSLLFLFFLILVIKMIVYPWWVGPAPFYDPYVDDTRQDTWTTTTTTTTVAQPDDPKWNIVGNLERKKARNGQFYVIDPVDKDKVWLNSSDDLYEDGAGKIWKLI